VRLRESGRVPQRGPERVDRLGQPVRGLQREPEVVPRHRMIGLEVERTPVGGDGIRGAVRRREGEAEIVVELRLVRDQRRGLFEQRQRFGRPVALVKDDAEEVQRVGMPRRGRERRAVVPLGRVEVAALMGGEGAGTSASGGGGAAGGADAGVGVAASGAAPGAPWQCL